MADQIPEQKDVEEQTKDKKEEIPVVDEEKAENGDSGKNGVSETEENGKEETNGEDSEEKVNVKRKSTSGDASEDTPVEGATPEKKPKLDEASPEEESKTEAEVAA